MAPGFLLVHDESGWLIQYRYHLDLCLFGSFTLNLIDPSSGFHVWERQVFSHPHPLSHLWLQTHYLTSSSEKAMLASHGWLPSKSNHPDNDPEARCNMFHPSVFFRSAPRFGKLPSLWFYQTMGRSTFGFI